MKIIEHWYKGDFAGYWTYGELPEGHYYAKNLQGVGAEAIFGYSYQGEPFTPEMWERRCEILGDSASPINQWGIVEVSDINDYAPPLFDGS